MKNLLIASFLTLMLSLSIFAQDKSVSVTSARENVTIKIDGRMFAGLYMTSQDGAYPHPTFDAPDAKLRLTIAPAKDIIIVNRFNNPRASSGGFDYFYVDIKNFMGKLPGHDIRLGRMKLDFGSETWINNPVDQSLIYNSASSAGGSDEGIQFSGPIVAGDMLSYNLGIYNGSSGAFAVAARNLATNIKLSSAPVEHLFVAVSLYNAPYQSNKDLAAVNTDFSIAGLSSAPGGAAKWSRSVTEIDLSWNYGKKGINSVFAKPTDGMPFRVAFAYGMFTDDVEDPSNIDAREGAYYYLNAMYNVTNDLYVGVRTSNVSLEEGQSATLNGVAGIDEYVRHGVGFGYKLNSLAHMKLEYQINEAKLKGDPIKNADDKELDLNVFTIGLGLLF